MVNRILTVACENPFLKDILASSGKVEALCRGVGDNLTSDNHTNGDMSLLFLTECH